MQILIPILPPQEGCNLFSCANETPLRSLRHVIGPSNPSQTDDCSVISAIFAGHADLKETTVRAFRERPDVPPSIDWRGGAYFKSVHHTLFLRIIPAAL